jgi:hypothetical protein
MKWFGEYWGAAICNETPHIAVPVGAHCSWCDEVFVAGDAGIVIDSVSEGPGDAALETPMHKNCFLRSVMGSIGHQRRECECYGGTEGDPEGMTKRQAADAAAGFARVREIARALNQRFTGKVQ